MYGEAATRGKKSGERGKGEEPDRGGELEENMKRKTVRTKEK